MSSRTMPSRAAVVHTLPATHRPGRRLSPTAGNQLGVRSRVAPHECTAASALASRVVLAASGATSLAVLAEAWSR